MAEAKKSESEKLAQRASANKERATHRRRQRTAPLLLVVSAALCEASPEQASERIKEHQLIRLIWQASERRTD